MKERTRNWPYEARRFIIDLSQKLDADSDDIVMQDLRFDDVSMWTVISTSMF